MEYFKLPMPQTREAKHKSSNNNISYGKLAAGSIMMNNRLLLLSLSFVTMLTCVGANVKSRKLLWGNDITTEEGQMLGRFELYEGEEPVNAVDAFVQNISSKIDLGNAIGFRNNLLDVVCESDSITCSTRVPLVYRKIVNDEHGKNLGAIEVYENEEVIDAVVRFLRQSKVSVDEIALKNYMFEQACSHARVLCTRNVAVVYNRMINQSDGSPIGRLLIYENEEPADKVFKWCKENNASEYYDFIVNSACESDGVICKRRQSVYLSISISDPDGGHINMLELKHGNEPADDIFAFFATNGLFKKNWDFRGMVKQICAKQSVDCKREKAVKYLDDNFSMGNRTLGRLVIWEDEEVVDVLYNIRMHYNLTALDQRISFNDICKRPEVPCNRFKAITYRKTQITKLDYEKFGNETCKRQFVGVKHLSSFSELPFGEKISKMLKGDAAVSAVEHPLFCVLLLFALQTLFFLLSSIPPLDTKISAPLKIVVPIFIIVLVSILQAVLVEPNVSVDKAMHTLEGKLPDLIILEGEEPVDALLKWGKEAAKVHHPIVRENIYWELLDELCNQTESLSCKRDRAWEYLDFGIMTHMGNEFAIDFYNPHVDPISRRECHPLLIGEVVVDTCIKNAAIDFCGYFVPPPNNCIRDITLHLASQLRITDEKRFDTKCSYKRLGLEMDAPGRELYKKAASEAMKRGMNMSPFARVDNGTISFDSWSKETAQAHTAIDTFAKIKDPEAREWNDKPCTPYFGGALCAKYDKDGNMMIEV